MLSSLYNLHTIFDMAKVFFIKKVGRSVILAYLITV